MNGHLTIPLLRHVLQVCGGALLARGYLDQAALDALTGLIINGATLFWWLYDHRKNSPVIKETG